MGIAYEELVELSFKDTKIMKTVLTDLYLFLNLSSMPLSCPSWQPDFNIHLLLSNKKQIIMSPSRMVRNTSWWILGDYFLLRNESSSLTTTISTMTVSLLFLPLSFGQKKEFGNQHLGVPSPTLLRSSQHQFLYNPETEHIETQYL